MAMIKCPECKKEVSNEAPSCPNCGYPLKATTIEKTSKKWKTTKLLSIVAVILGIILISSKSFTLLSPFLIFLGVVMFIVSVIGSWWFHG